MRNEMEEMQRTIQDHTNVSCLSLQRLEELRRTTLPEYAEVAPS